MSQDPPAGVSPPSECWTASRSDSVVSRRRPPLAASCHRHCNKVELSTCGCDAGAAGLLQTQRRGWGAKRHRPYNCTSGLTVHSPPPRRRGTTGVETAVEGEGGGGEGGRGSDGGERQGGREEGRCTVYSSRVCVCFSGHSAAINRTMSVINTLLQNLVSFRSIVTTFSASARCLKAGASLKANTH